MKSGLRLALFSLLGLGGCSYLDYGARNLIATPIDWAQECLFTARMRRLAHKHWEQIPCEERQSYSKAYAKGFEDGFVDYIEKDGTGDPLAMPPFHYQRDELRSPKGHDECLDWFAGFRHGVKVAKETGIRESVVVPIGVPPRQVADPPQVAPTGLPAVVEPDQVLPPPQKLESR